MFGDIVEKKPISIAEANEILAGIKRKKNYEQNIAFEYSAKFSKMKTDKATKLFDELNHAGIPRIKRRNIIKLIDIMPSTPEELRAVFAKEDLSLSKEDTEKVLEILTKYR
ncbi:MAG: DNA-directed RNA polymerase subunit F [Candidatus Altiarchaeota archaeon]|nr:DNA-directed RNA polymerase subunit F [Candidatus Altiarchaeota archaeon]